MARKKRHPRRTHRRKQSKARPSARRRARPRRVAKARAPSGPPATRGGLVRGAPKWLAYEALVQRLESTCGEPLKTVHRRLDREGMRGRTFLDLVGRIVELYGVTESYAGTIVDTYPGYSGREGPPSELRIFLQLRQGAAK